MSYPFSALVGQDQLTLALLLCGINPGIGGVLIQGDKGTAKSTAARALSEILPPIQRIAGSRFNTEPGQVLDFDVASQSGEYETEEVAVPLVNLPLGASEDRLLGQLDLESVLNERRRALQPGLLAQAHRGILYIDEVNLLPDHLVDVLLDVAASGVNTVQREGLSVSHPSRFVLIGTMNPEEGALRPQFLDRFGLMVNVQAPDSIAERTEVVRRRMAYDQSPQAFLHDWQPAQVALQARIAQARERLPQVQMPEGLLTLISQLCTQLQISSLRADLVLYKTAITLAAFEGRMEVQAADIKRAAELVLPHRRRKKPFESPSLHSSELDDLMNAPPPPLPQPEPETEPAEEEVLGVAPVAEPPALTVENHSMEALNGRRSEVARTPRGFKTQTVPSTSPTDLALTASVQQALIRDPETFQLSRQDLHQTIRTGKTGHFILFVVDASGSMAASRRMEAVKGSVLSLLTDAYQRRDTVAVIAFRGVEAQLLLEPTQSVERAEVALRTLPTGGRTPLPQALQLALDVLEQQPENPLLIILSDGKANVPLPGGGDAWQQTLELATRLRTIPALVLDTDTAYVRLGRASELARTLGAECVSLEDFSAETLTRTVSGLMS